MPILTICHDGPKGATLREKHKRLHLEYIKKMAPMICAAGPMRQSADAIENKQDDSSFFIYDTNDMAIAHKLLNNDPFAKNGVYQHVSFAEIRTDAGHWVGGIS